MSTENISFANLNKFRFSYINSGADPGFLERGFLCIKVWGSRCGFYLIFIKYPTETKLFQFHRIFKNGRHGVGFERPPPLNSLWIRSLMCWLNVVLQIKPIQVCFISICEN